MKNPFRTKKKVYWPVALLLAAPLVHADCPPPQSSGQTLADTARATADKIINTMDTQLAEPDEVVKAAQAYFRLIDGPPSSAGPCDKHQDPPHFDAKAAEARANDVLKVANNQALPDALRVQAYIIYADIIGTTGSQQSSGEDGGNAVRAFHSALAIDKTNEDAILGQAEAIFAVLSRNSFVQKMAAHLMNINLDQEKTFALENLRKISGPACLIQKMQ